MKQLSDCSEIMELLWQHYSEENPLEYPLVLAGEKVFEPVFDELSNEWSNQLFRLIAIPISAMHFWREFGSVRL